MGLRQASNFTAIDMHTVGGDAARPQDAVGLQAFYDTLLITSDAVAFIRNIFGDMYMKANTQFSTSGGATFKSGRAEGKGGVQSVARGEHARLCLLTAFGAQ